jgi:DNA segregation ATPase FtsK/SpoIIIE, S-DNA-T family
MASLKRPVAGQLAQVDNPDPFARPVWRSPVYETPWAVIWLAQLIRLLWRAFWFLLTHPILDVVAAALVCDWLWLGWPGLVALVLLVASALVGLRLALPAWFTRLIGNPARNRWRAWFYRRHWHAAMTLGGLAPMYRKRVLVPVLAAVRASRSVDAVTVRLATGQAPADFADRAASLAHAFGTELCRVRELGPGVITLEFVRADTLAEPFGALPFPAEVNLSALPVGRAEDGGPWLLRLLGTHVLIAGATGSGKGSVIWSAVRALLPAIVGGWCQVWALDPKRMELSFGKPIFTRYADQAADMVKLLEDAVGVMHDRAAQFGGITRTFTPSIVFPFLVVLVDEMAFITAYQPDRDLRRRAEAAGPLGGGETPRR